MLNIIGQFVTYLFAIYGFLSLVYLIAREFIKPDFEDTGIKLVIIEKNQENRIEGIINNVITGDLVKRLVARGKVTVLDMGSEDGTLEILKKLKEKHNVIELLEESNRHAIFEDFK
ncbi:MAG TPA: hypothetical protein GXX49_04165 [Clostridiaceae bacterium]|nr:hypothetical protein [Clostridiaceae bacterium]